MNKLLLVFALLAATLAYGSDSIVTTLPIRSQVVDSLVSTRLTYDLNYLEKALFHTERNNDRWWKTWTVLYGAATIGQGGVAVLSANKATRQDMVLGAGTTVLGVASMLITPVCTDFKAIGPDSVANLSDSDKIKLRKKYEALLMTQADIARTGKSWQTHALSGAVNLASGLITWVGFKRSFGEGVLSFALNTVITEAQIWTQPVWAQKHAKKVLWNLNEEGMRPNSDRSPEWYGLAGPAGIRIGLRF